MHYTQRRREHKNKSPLPPKPQETEKKNRNCTEYDEGNAGKHFLENTKLGYIDGQVFLFCKNYIYYTIEKRGY